MIKIPPPSSLCKILGEIWHMPLLVPLFMSVLFLVSSAGYGQATLPFSHNGPWQTVTKTGYSQSGLGADLANIGPTSEGNSANFTTVGTKLIIHFDNAPGTLSYYLKANTTQTTYSSTFTIEQSADGITYSPLKTVVDQSKDGTTLNIDDPAPSTRFIKFELTAVSECLIMLDEIMLTQAMPEINIKQVLTNIASGDAYNFNNVEIGGSSGARAFKVENTGKAVLSLTGTPIVAISGTHASEFVIDQTTTASSIIAGANTSFTITFNPSDTGTRTATVTIKNNDSNESTYTINLTGNGTTPSLVPTITSFSPAEGLEGSLVIITGTNLVSVSSITFNGVESLNFFENSDTEIEVEVPVGATTGLLTVTTPEGTATSAEVFTILAPAITVTASLTPFSAATGTTSAPQSYTVSGTDLSENITISAPAYFEVSLTSDSGFGTSVVLAQVSGTVHSTTVYVRYAPTTDGGHSGDISHASTGAPTQLLAASGTTIFPQVTITGAFTTVTNQVINTSTGGQLFTIEGKNLTDNITISAPANFEVSSASSTSGFGSSIIFTQSAGSVAATNFWIRYNPATLLTHSDNVVAASSGATSQSIAVNGNAITTEPTAPSFISTGTTTTSSVELSFGGGDGARRIVVAHQGIAIDSNPVDGTTYFANANFGSGSQIGTGNYVVYAGTGSSVTVTGLGGGTKYYFTVYDYNDAGLAGAENYLTPGNSTNKTTPTATYVWNVASGNWDEANNWNPARTMPSNTDILIFDGAVQANPAVTINFSTINTIGQLKFINNTNTQITIDSDATLNLQTAVDQAGDDFVVEAGSALTVSATSSSKKLLIYLKTGKTGAVAGAVTLEGSASAAHRLIPEDVNALTFQTGSTFTAGTFFSGYPFGIASGSVTVKTGATYVRKSGSGPFGAPVGFEILTFESGSTYRHEATTAPDLSGRTYGHFELNHPDFNQPNLTGAGTLSVENLTVMAGTAMGINLTGTINIKGNITVNAGNLSFGPGSPNTINLSANGSQTISGSGGLSFNSNAAVYLRPTAIVHLEKDMVLDGSMTVQNALHMNANVISGAGTFSMDAATTLGIGHADGISYSDGLNMISNTGNVQVAGMRDYSMNGNYIYNGTVPQITGDGLPVVVYTLTINNATGVTSNVFRINVQGELALQSGNFITSASNGLIMEARGSISGGSSSSFVHGPLAQIVEASTSTKVFPIGKGSTYLPVTLNVDHSDNQQMTYTAEQFNAAPPARTLTGDLKRVSDSRHFTITKLGGADITAASVTLHYNNDINEPIASNLRIAKSSGADWVNIGGTGSASGTEAGTITSGNFTTFSDFVVASITEEPAPLPVSLVSFYAMLADGKVELNWVTASEQNNDRFEIERSPNGIDYQMINTMRGAGTTNERVHYNYTDRKPLIGISYYRLKQVDYNGASAYSRTIAVKNDSRVAEISMYPNPTAEVLQVELGAPARNIQIRIVNTVGQVVYTQEVSKLSSRQRFHLDVSRLPKGAYHLLIQSDELETTRRKFIKTDR